MTDRELLELAAKAVGITGLYDEEMNAFVQNDNEYFPTVWRPHTNNDDSLQLIANLRLVVRPGKYKGDGCTVESQREGVAGCTAFRDCPQEQIRYAVLFVAAEIGRAMP